MSQDGAGGSARLTLSTMNTAHVPFALMAATGAVVTLSIGGRMFVTGEWPGRRRRPAEYGLIREHSALTMWVLSWGVAFSIFAVAMLVRDTTSVYLWCVGTALLLSGWTLAIIRNRYVRKYAVPTTIGPTEGQSSLHAPGRP